jgi:large subunit ribosomal protein L13
MAKLQVGTTHELATVPNLPLIDHLYQKTKAAEALGLAGLVATWNFGNDFSLNTAVFGRLARTVARPAPREFVSELAEEYFPGVDGGEVAQAISHFSDALAYFPFDIPMLYFGPANHALAYPLTLAPLTGKPMGRTAAQAAVLLRGKHKPTYTPNVDCGDFVIIINAAQAVLTGNKLEQKLYRTHSGWIGNLKEVQYKKIMAERPEFAMQLAVKGMMAKNNLDRLALRRLRIFKGDVHKHEAQKPVAWTQE